VKAVRQRPDEFLSQSAAETVNDRDSHDKDERCTQQFIVITGSGVLKQKEAHATCPDITEDGSVTHIALEVDNRI